MDKKYGVARWRDVPPYLFCWFSSRDVRPWFTGFDVRESNDFQAVLLLALLEASLLLPGWVQIGFYFGRSALKIFAALLALSLIALNYYVFIFLRWGVGYRRTFRRLEKRERYELTALATGFAALCFASPVMFVMHSR